MNVKMTLTKVKLETVGPAGENAIPLPVWALCAHPDREGHESQVVRHTLLIRQKSKCLHKCNTCSLYTNSMIYGFNFSAAVCSSSAEPGTWGNQTKATLLSTNNLIVRAFKM